MPKILIRHLSGSRASQLDQFPEETKEITIGREPGVAVQYDAQSDVVSRQHVKIAKDSGGCCQLCDVQSRNGTFLNHQRILGPVRLSHNDIVQLGTGGPEFRFELDPPPVEAKPTRFVSTERSAGVTREATATAVVPLPVSHPVGRATVERMLDANFGQVKKQSTKFLQFVLAAALLGLVLASVFYLRLERKAEQSEALVGQQQQLLRQMDEQLEQQPDETKALRKQISKLGTDLQKSEARTAQNFESISKALGAPGSPAAKAPVTSDPVVDKVRASWRDFQKNPAQGEKEVASLILQNPNRWEPHWCFANMYASQHQLSQVDYECKQALGIAPAYVKPDLTDGCQQLDARAKGTGAAGAAGK